MSKTIRIRSKLAAAVESAVLPAYRSPQIKRADLDAALDEVGTPESIRRSQAIIRRNTGVIASVDR
ncbi:MAG: hypothetical protein GXX91_02255 [Verrucomicrobiaceae bacterium]|nr:hypothetical protein [Verrucomicrobiaceae bacterium]